MENKEPIEDRYDLEHLSYEIRGCIYRVLVKLGPGLLESVYEAALIYELKKAGLRVERQVGIPVIYDEVSLDLGFRIDILVEDLIILEIKSVEKLHEVHKKQVLTYLKLTGKKLGLLINFNVAFLKDKESLIRIIN